MAFQWGQTIDSPGNWDESEQIRELMGLKGQKLGDWIYEAANPGTWEQSSNPMGGDSGDQMTNVGATAARRYMDTKYGRIEQTQIGDQSGRGEGGGDPARWQTHLGIGRHANEHGSDGIRGNVNDDGVLDSIKMDRESNAEMNTWLAIMATVGVGGYLAAGAGAAGAASTAGLSASEIAQLALAAGSVYGATRGSQGGGSQSAGSGDGGPAGEVKGPEAPPPPPILEYGAFVEDAAAANAARTRNKTNLNPASVSNMLVASGNLLLGA